MALDPIYHGYRPGPSIPSRDNTLLALLAGGLQGRAAKVQEDQRQKNAMIAGALPSLISQGYDPSSMLGIKGYNPTEIDTPWGRMPIGMAEKRAQIEKDMAAGGMSMDELSTPEGIERYRAALNSIKQIVGDDPLAYGSVGAGGKVKLSYGQDAGAAAVNKIATMMDAARGGFNQANALSNPNQIFKPDDEDLISRTMKLNKVDRETAINFLLRKKLINGNQ